MRVGLLTAWANRINGGVFEAVATHAAMLADHGLTPHVFALAHPDDHRDAFRLEGIEVTRVPVLGPEIVGIGRGLTRQLVDSDLDIVHLHGIWTHVSANGIGWARATGRPYIISPHSMLDPWIISRGTFKKAVAKAWFERRSWQSARLFHALTDDEADDITRATGRRDFAIIPNSIAIPDEVACPADPPTMLAIARIHPKKNLIALVRGWRLSKAGENGWRLVIAGWGADSDVAELEDELGDNPQADAIAFVGPKFGEEKARLLGEASFAILPSHSEGLPMGVLEAWAAGVPSIMSEASHLPQGYARGAALPIGTSVEAIAQGIREAMNVDSPTRAAMARAARELAIEQFSQAAVGVSWTGLYRSLVGVSG